MKFVIFTIFVMIAMATAYRAREHDINISELPCRPISLPVSTSIIFIYNTKDNYFIFYKYIDEENEKNEIRIKKFSFYSTYNSYKFIICIKREKQIIVLYR